MACMTLIRGVLESSSYKVRLCLPCGHPHSGKYTTLPMLSVQKVRLQPCVVLQGRTAGGIMANAENAQDLPVVQLSTEARGHLEKGRIEWVLGIHGSLDSPNLQPPTPRSVPPWPPSGHPRGSRASQRGFWSS